MKIKNVALTLALASGVVVTGVAPTTTQAAELTKTQLHKQISTLKAQVKSKDATIKKLNSQLKGNYVLKTVNSQLFYKGYLSPAKVSIGNTTVPSLLDYKGIYYAPVQQITSMLSLPYSKNSKIVYIGSKPEGQFMMDIKSLRPYNKFSYDVNTKMTLGGVPYNKGISLDANGKELYSINLGGKYTNIKGLVGLENSELNEGSITISDENDNVLYDSILNQGDLPKELDIDVTGVKNLKIHADGAMWSETRIDLVNLIIK